ncbi:hypothetical protein BDV23DRAFT_107757 [Aspergillus alliaceus]|uniref:Uncharacterized protein n=1 Tax=Petromyces alliaceus TaxID=209559 RepID=A0A5N7C3P6_PETAA|nr:hypothetical protein BDV23DRAFT_107757 [Aspergillus alliaceus]
MTSTPNSICGDGWFGPVVATGHCRGGFDFTVSFEASVLNFVPAACGWSMVQMNTCVHEMQPAAWNLFDIPDSPPIYDTRESDSSGP